MIYFVTVQLNEQVHAQALGFTNTIYQYCHADSPANAVRTSQAWCVGRGLQFKSAAASESTQQDPARFTFVENIHGLPESAFEECMKQVAKRGFPEHMVAESRKSAAANRALVARGLAMLDAAAVASSQSSEGVVA